MGDKTIDKNATKKAKINFWPKDQQSPWPKVKAEARRRPT